MFTGEMSWRRLRVILDHLPPESAYRTAVWNTTDHTAMPPPEPGVFGPWSQADLLLARIGDRVDALIYMQADPKTRGNPPQPYPRPGVEDRVKPMSATDMAILEYILEHHGEAPPDGWQPDL